MFGVKIRSALRSLTASATALGIFVGCTGSDQRASETKIPSSDNVDQIIFFQKTQGINVGESNSIWAVGMIRTDPATLSLNVDRISLTVGENFKKMSWTIPVPAPLIPSSTGTRTFLSEWGLLIGRGSGSSGHIGVFVVDHVANKYELVFTASNAKSGARATPFSYRARGTDGKDYHFIAVAYKEDNGNIRIERFLVDELNSDIKTRFKRVRPFSSPSGRVTANGAVYSGFLYPNCGTDGCKPIFFAAFMAQTQGYDLNLDVPPTPYNASAAPLVAPLVDQANLNFSSLSHPPDGPFGSVNDFAYSMAGDPNDGYVYLASDQSLASSNSHVAYDRTNELVFRVGKASKIGPNGIDENNTPQALVTVFKRKCFFDNAFKNCDPRTTAHSRIYTDVGEEIGPSSDLGNGCVAILGWRRPADPGASTFRPGVYTACIRDPNNLDKGLAVTKIGETLGATYMYNDFTGAYQSDRPVTFLFDLTEKKVTNTAAIRMLWVPKLGFTDTLTGLNVRYRCMKKGTNPPAFKPYPNFPKAVTMTDIPGCAGPGINQVEFELTRIPKQRFTRFDSFTVVAVKQ